MMKRLVTILFFAALALLAAALIAPGFINWNNHKDRIIAELEPFVQRKIAIGGNVRFKVLPQPQLLLEDVTVSNAEGASAGYLLHLNQLEARIRLGALLNGRFEVENINLTGPDLNLEVMDGGKANWKDILKDRGAPEKISIAPSAVQLNRVTVAGGTIHYINHVTGSERQVDNVNLTITADTLYGPYRIGGSFGWQGAAVNVDAATGKYDGSAPVPLKISLTPAAPGLPQAQVNGVLDVASGMDMQGDITISQGNLASLGGDAGLAFLNDETNFASAFAFKGDTVSFSDIKAKFGKEGTLSGAVSVQFARDKKPAVSAQLEGANLTLSDKPGATALPEGFTAGLNLKGRNITWEGRTFPAALFQADAGGGDWAIKQARLSLPGKSEVSIAGVITPAKSFSALSVQVRTEDLGKLLESSGLPDNNILKIFSAVPELKKVSFAASADIKPEKIVLTDVDALLEDKVKMSGGLGISRMGTRPEFGANLTIDGWDSAIFPPGPLLEKIMGADGTLELSFTNFKKDDFKIASLKVSAKTDAQGLTLKEVTATTGEDEGFDLNGHVAALEPMGAFDVEYGVKLADGTAFAKAFGLPLPPPLREWKAARLHGKVSGDPAKYKFTAEGKLADGDLSLDGSVEAGVYQEAININRPGGGEVLSLMGLPIEKLLIAQDGGFQFSGALTGARDAFRIDNIQSRLGAAPLGGAIERKDGKYNADLTLDKIDFDNWLWNDWAVKEGMALTLHGKTLEWRGMTVADPVVMMDAGASSIKISKLTGKLWGGDVDVSAGAERKDKTWSGTLKGTVTNAALDKLRTVLGISGVTLGNGSLDLNLASDGAKFFEAFKSVSGTVGLKTDSLTVAEFNPAEVSHVLMQIAGPMANLQQLVNHALKETGEGRYADVSIPLKIADGKASFESVKLTGDNHVVTVSANLDLTSDDYDLSCNVALKKPEGVPAIKMHRVDGLKKTGDYGVDLRAVESWLAQKTMQVAAPAAPAAPAATPTPAPANGKAAVDGILKRLDTQ